MERAKQTAARAARRRSNDLGPYLTCFLGAAEQAPSDDFVVQEPPAQKHLDDLNERVVQLRAELDAVRAETRAELDAVRAEARTEKRARIEQDVRLGAVEQQLSALQKALGELRAGQKNLEEHAAES